MYCNKFLILIYNLSNVKLDFCLKITIKTENLSLRYILKDKRSINNLPIKNAIVKTFKKIYKIRIL